MHMNQVFYIYFRLEQIGQCKSKCCFDEKKLF